MLMENRFQRPFESYWEQFGYEIGGPVCYAYVDWIINELETHYPDINHLMFVARDGWLLKQAFELLPHKESIISHYVYAPRSVLLQCQNEATLAEYKSYIESLSLGNGTIALVDTVTMKFSSQRLLASAMKNNIHGFFWLTLGGGEEYGRNFQFTVYQREDYHTIRCWNLMEFIMTSPEPPIKMVVEGCPVYQEPQGFEKKRSPIFRQIESGVLQFIQDIVRTGGNPHIANRWITQWVNEFLKNPDDTDRNAFSDVRFSELEDHSDDIPLDPFGQYDNRITLKRLKDRIWFFSQRHHGLYRLLSFVNRFFKRSNRS